MREYSKPFTFRKNCVVSSSNYLSNKVEFVRFEYEIKLIFPLPFERNARPNTGMNEKIIAANKECLQLAKKLPMVRRQCTFHFGRNLRMLPRGYFERRL